VRRRRINTRGAVYLGNTIVGQMHLEATVAPNGTVCGTVQDEQVAQPLGHPVSAKLTMVHPSEPKLRMPLDDGSAVEFHIATTLGSLINARWLPPS